LRRNPRNGGGVDRCEGSMSTWTTPATSVPSPLRSAATPPPVVVPEDRRRQHRSTSLSYTLDAYARQAHVIGRVEYSSKGRT
jgi:hypothetical protein